MAMQLSGSLNLTGSLNVSGSNTQIGTNSFIGSNFISGGLIISSSQNQTPATFQIYGDIRHNGATFYQPVDITLNPALSGSYIFSSGSTYDLHFIQNAKGFANTTRLRWVEGNLYTGLLKGGIISAVTGSTTFNISSGSGVVVTLNASKDEEPYPTIKYVNWDNLSNVSITNLTKAIQTFVAIKNDGTVHQQTNAFTDGDYDNYITLGTVLHQNKSTINATISYPNVAYGYKQRTYDFIRAFGPLKLSGLTLLPSGSKGLQISAGTAFADGRNYQNNPNSPSYITDSGTNVSKLFRYYQSGSEFVQDTNNALGYTDVDSDNYNNNGTLTTLSGNNVNNYYWSIKRVFWYPNSATKGIVVYYGNAQYSSKIKAQAGLSGESFSEVENTKQNAVYVGAILARKDLDFTNPLTYEIIQGGLFRSVTGGGGAGGGGGATSLGQLSDVLLTSPNNGDILRYDSATSNWVNVNTSSFAVTSSANIFYGKQSITGSLNISGSVTINTNRIDDSWIPYTPEWTANSSNPSIGDGTIEGYYKLIGKTCFVRGNIAMGSTTTFGSGEWYVSMPFTASHADAILMAATLLDNGSAWYNATMAGARAGFNHKSAIQYQTTGGTADDVNATAPFTWASSDRFIWNGSYEIA